MHCRSSEKEDDVKQKLLFGLLFGVLVLAPAALAQTTVRCETGECAFYGNATVSLSHQLSDANCVEGKSWGVRNNTIWVKRGCRADFMITPRNATYNSGYNASLPATVRCESNGSRKTCFADTHFGVQMTRQLSDRGCIEGKSWGFTDRGIWVDNGCRADFLLAAPGYSSSAPMAMNAQLITCESVNNTRHRCATDTRFGVQLSRQISDNNCVFGKSWGYDRKGVWVSRGCRAEFSVGR